MDVDGRLHFLWNLCLNGLFRPTLLFAQVRRCVTKSDSLQQMAMVTWIKTVISDNLQPSLISAKVCWLTMGYVKLKKKTIKQQGAEDAEVKHAQVQTTSLKTKLSFCTFYTNSKQGSHSLLGFLSVCFSANNFTVGTDCMSVQLPAPGVQHLTLSLRGMLHQLLLIQLNSNNFSYIFQGCWSLCEVR